ncbi:hypothetical protein IKR55_05495 [bacterium]|jgi:hypothetical protein|nr:hypothetical protein [bacterium]
MFNAIDEVKRQYTYAVQPVKLFEANHSQAAQKFVLDFDFVNQMNKTGNNPFHPDVSNTHKGQKLDLMG